MACFIFSVRKVGLAVHTRVIAVQTVNGKTTMTTLNIRRCGFACEDVVDGVSENEPKRYVHGTNNMSMDVSEDKRDHV